MIERLLITIPDEDCTACEGTGLRLDDMACDCTAGYRTPTTADHIADLVALPPAERVARLVAMLRACPDEAVEAVDACKVARAWEPGRGGHRWRDSLGRPRQSWGDGIDDAALLADGWALAGVKP